MTIDSHFHSITMRDKGLTFDGENLIGLDIALSPGDYSERKEIIGNSYTIFASGGAGPWCLNEGIGEIDTLVSLIREEIETFNLDAVGECGFDGYRNYGTKEKQKELFERQADLSAFFHLPLIIHSRDSKEETLSSLSSIKVPSIFHCFSYDEETAEKILSFGHYISFAGNVTYKQNNDLANVAKIVPIDRLLVETDSPYLSPAPLRGSLNTPPNTSFIISFISSLRGTEIEELKNQVTKNFFAVMGKNQSSRKV